MTVCFEQIYKPDQDERLDLVVTVFRVSFVVLISWRYRIFFSCRRFLPLAAVFSHFFKNLFFNRYLQNFPGHIEISVEHFPHYLYEINTARQKVRNTIVAGRALYASCPVFLFFFQIGSGFPPGGFFLKKMCCSFT